MKDDASPPQRAKTLSWPLVTRLLASLALLGSVVSACSDAASPPGYREHTPSSGAGGGGTSAVAGSKAVAGDGGEGPGGAADGGEPAMGGGGGRAGSGGGAGLGGGGSTNGGSGGGTAGGAGGPSVTCGDGKKDAGEDCDDGNLLDLDGCSSSCKTKCEACVDYFYGDDPDYQWFVDQYRNNMTVASEGPALGVPRSKLAQKLLACIVRSECLLDTPIAMEGCYCGGVSNVECDAGKAKGPCVKEIGEAAEGKEPSIIADRLTNVTLAAGIAVELANLQGSRGYCVEACKADRDVTPCERCLAGPATTMDVPQTGCTTCLTSGVCDPRLIECADQKCASGDLEPCLKKPTNTDDLTQPWPCRDVALAAIQQVDATADYLRCRNSQCKDECAPK
jgi:cysteine-rich repeat protein